MDPLSTSKDRHVMACIYCLYRTCFVASGLGVFHRSPVSQNAPQDPGGQLQADTWPETLRPGRSCPLKSKVLRLK